MQQTPATAVPFKASDFHVFLSSRAMLSRSGKAIVPESAYPLLP